MYICHRPSLKLDARDEEGFQDINLMLLHKVIVFDNCSKKNRAADMKHHTAMKYVGSVRRELGIRTIFNILGPLTNPANPTMEIMGVFDESLLESMAHVLSNLGVKKGMVVYGMEKLDEISICGPTKVCLFRDNTFECRTIVPEDVGLKSYGKEELKGGTPEENAAITLSILKGEEKGAKRDAAVINAAAALFVADKAPSLKEAVRLAEETIDSGRAFTQLEKFIRYSNLEQA